MTNQALSRPGWSWPFRAWRVLVLWGPVVAQMAVIYTASSVPDLTALPGGIPDWAAHGAAYAALGALSLRAFAGGRRAGVTLAAVGGAVALATLYGVTDEWHQTFVPGRSATLSDLAADAVGATLAALAGWGWSTSARAPRRAEAGRARRV